ncbi:DUF5631 domain-containing protein [soil metagenome]
MRKATRQALSVPTFRMPDDCTPWVLGGVWPAELNHLTAETASIAEYLKRDLERIAESANHKLRAINDASMPEPVRKAEQSRVIDVSRAFAVLRVESTVRQLRTESVGFAEESTDRRPAIEEPTQMIALARPTALPSEAIESEADEPEVNAQEPEPARAEPEPSMESDEQRLRRLVDGVARQEPGIRWAAGLHADGSTVLVTDLAYGWIPPGIVLPAGVDLLAPDRRRGGVKAMLGSAEAIAVYTPGDRFSRNSVDPKAGRGARRAPEVDDLGWQLAEATRWRNGLPRITHTLAKAAGSGTGVVDAELEVLRVHLDTARYQLVARYPEVDAPLLLNCLLLAATEALATGGEGTANYHFAWFQALSAPPAGNWQPDC